MNQPRCAYCSRVEGQRHKTPRKKKVCVRSSTLRQKHGSPKGMQAVPGKPATHECTNPCDVRGKRLCFFAVRGKEHCWYPTPADHGSHVVPTYRRSIVVSRLTRSRARRFLGQRSTSTGCGSQVRRVSRPLEVLNCTRSSEQANPNRDWNTAAHAEGVDCLAGFVLAIPAPTTTAAQHPSLASIQVHDEETTHAYVLRVKRAVLDKKKRYQYLFLCSYPPGLCKACRWMSSKAPRFSRQPRGAPEHSGSCCLDLSAGPRLRWSSRGRSTFPAFTVPPQEKQPIQCVWDARPHFVDGSGRASCLGELDRKNLRKGAVTTL